MANNLALSQKILVQALFSLYSLLRERERENDATRDAAAITKHVQRKQQLCNINTTHFLHSLREKIENMDNFVLLEFILTNRINYYQLQCFVHLFFTMLIHL